MANYLKARTPILAIILALLAVGYTFANSVVVIPMDADTVKGQWALVGKSGQIIRQSGGISVTHAPPGHYYINFGSDTTGYSISATARVPDTFRVLSVTLCGGTENDGSTETYKCATQHNNKNTVWLVSVDKDYSLSDTSFYVSSLP